MDESNVNATDEEHEQRDHDGRWRRARAAQSRRRRRRARAVQSRRAPATSSSSATPAPTTSSSKPDTRADRVAELLGLLGGEEPRTREPIDSAWKIYVATIPPVSRDKAECDWSNRIAPTFAGAFIDSMKESTMLGWEQELRRQGFASATVRNAGHRLSGAIKLAVREGRVERVPWGAWRPASARTESERECCRTIEEFARLVDAARRRDANVGKSRRRGGTRANRDLADLAARVTVIGLCGLRNGEAAALGFDDVEIDEPPHVLHLRHQAHDQWKRFWPKRSRPLEPPKNGARDLVMHPDVVAALRAQRALLEERGWYRSDGPVFPKRGGAWCTHNACIRPERFKKLVKEAGLPHPEKWCVHSLRHSFATLELIASGGDLRAVQRRTGHSSIEVLAGYLHRIGRGLQETALPLLELEHGPAREPPPVVVDRPVVPPQRETTAATKRLRAYRARHVEDADPDFLDLEDLARRWKEHGAWWERPIVVTRAAGKVYSRTYVRALRALGNREHARAAGREAYEGFLTSWDVLAA